MISRYTENKLIKYNAGILSGFLRHKNDADNKLSHHFAGRYENIYIDQDKIPELAPVFDVVSRHASEILGLGSNKLQSGYWFNYMLTGQRTLPHSHDEDNELLSCIYYVSVPDQSGQLFLGEGNNQEIIIPEESLIVFFPTDLIHSVGENKSAQPRLSIAINIGEII